MKKIINICVGIIIIILFSILTACSKNQPSELTFRMGPTGAVVTGVRRINNGHVIVHAYYNGQPVTEIRGSAFVGIATLTSVTLNEGLQTIGMFAFTQTSITEINIPGSVRSIGSQTFFDIPTLTSVILNEGLQTIGGWAFWGTSITEIYIPSSVTSIGQGAFEDIDNLTSVTLNEGLQTIGWDAFSGTAITEITIPLTVTFMHRHAFNSNVNVNLFGTLGLLGFEIINGEVTILGFNFGQISNEIVIPPHINGYPVTRIAAEAFVLIDTLTSVILNEGLQVIGRSAFAVTSITEITIPSTVTFIGDNAFPESTVIIRE